MTLSDFVRLRPYVYHLTDRTNVAGICEQARLYPACALLPKAKLGERRRRSFAVKMPWGAASIRDQQPLHLGAVKFSPNWDGEQLVAYLNQHVFFWPGNESGPVAAGKSHFARYRSERPVVIRMTLQSLLDANRSQAVLLSRYNSGAPRCSSGRRSPRGPETFLPIRSFDGTASEVVEVVFRGAVRIPSEAMQADLDEGRWVKLFSVAKHL
jgi:hypothetical protein